MLKCAAPALTVPALMVLLVATEVRPPQWMTTPPVTPSPVAASATPAVSLPKPQPKREVPPILAVDERIKKRLHQLRPSVKHRLAKVARRLPKRVKLLVTSAYRTRHEQAKLRPTFGIKARPGHSPHEDGRAIDLNVLVDGERISPRKNQAVIGKIMADAGFKYLGHHDPVHYSVPKAHIVPHAEPMADLDVMTMQELQELEELQEPRVPQVLEASAAGAALAAPSGAGTALP